MDRPMIIWTSIIKEIEAEDVRYIFRPQEVTQQKAADDTDEQDRKLGQIDWKMGFRNDATYHLEVHPTSSHNRIRWDTRRWTYPAIPYQHDVIFLKHSTYICTYVYIYI